MALLRTSIAVILTLCYLTSAAPFRPGRGLRASSPIVRRSNNSQKSGAIGLGDGAGDMMYSIEIAVGSTMVPVILDTGSSDLWSIGTGCSNTSCGSIGNTPQLVPSSLNATGIPFEIDYGDSKVPTNATGMIFSAPVGLAGLQIEDQLVAAVNQTNTGLPDSGLSGIFGLSFPTSSSIFARARLQAGGPSPNISLAESADRGRLEEPMFTISLQRDAANIGGNVGQLTIGQLPDGVSNESLTWVPVRLYTEDQGGLAAPTSSPNELYPVNWEIPLDDVLLNGTTLEKPATLNSSIGYTATIDSGTSNFEGPQDVVASILATLATGTASPDAGESTIISCDTPVDMAFVIGGKNFPVDPRDFLGASNSTTECTAAMIDATDPPGLGGGLRSWILGDPFMKSNLVAFYFGNLTHPSVDPPRIGFLSTVPSNANDLFSEAVNSAKSEGSFESTTVAAPTGTFSAAATNSLGVAQAGSP